MLAGALPQTPLGSLQRSPGPLACFKGAASRQEGNVGEGRTRRGEREGKRGKLGNSALVVGGIDAPGSRHFTGTLPLELTGRLTSPYPLALVPHLSVCAVTDFD